MSDPAAPPVDPLTRPDPWNSVAAGYDETFFPLAEGLVEEAMGRMRLDPQAVVLDVATGPGTFAIRAAPRVARLVAVDFAENMIARLRARLEAEQIANVEAHVMDGHALDLPASSFDAVVSLFGWFLFSDRARGLQEMCRVVRPGGRVMATSWAVPDVNTVVGTGFEAMRSALPDLPRPPSPPATQNPETCAAEFRAAGLVDVTTEFVGRAAHFASVEEFWDLFERGGAPLVVLRQRLGAAAVTAASARALAHLRERLGSGPVELRAEAILTSGVRA